MHTYGTLSENPKTLRIMCIYIHISHIHDPKRNIHKLNFTIVDRPLCVKRLYTVREIWFRHVRFLILQQIISRGKLVLYMISIKLSMLFRTCWKVNPNLGSWGRIWLPRLWTGITPEWLKIWKILKLMYSSKKSLEYILLSTFEWKKVFSTFLKPKSVCNCSFFCHVHIFLAAWKVYLTSRTSSTTTPGLGTTPANSRHTKQFWSCPHGL